MAVLVILVTVFLAVDRSRTRLQVYPQVSVAPGIEVECREESLGLIHHVTIHLREPTVRVELGPVVAAPSDYPLVWLPTWARETDWVVAVSAGDFATMWGRYALAGHSGQPRFTVIHEGRMVQERNDGAVLWFDEHQTGHLDKSTESTAYRTSARWAIGGHDPCVWNGLAAVLPEPTCRERRTVVGLDQTGCVLTLVTFESATLQQSATWLAAQGVWRAMELGTAENAGIVVNPLSSEYIKGNSMPQRFVAHALGIRSTAAK